MIFFSGKILVCSCSIYFFVVWLAFDFFFTSVQFISFVKRKANSAIEQQKVKVTKNVIDFLCRKGN